MPAPPAPVRRNKRSSRLQPPPPMPRLEPQLFPQPPGYVPGRGLGGGRSRRRGFSLGGGLTSLRNLIFKRRPQPVSSRDMPKPLSRPTPLGKPSSDPMTGKASPAPVSRKLAGRTPIEPQQLPSPSATQNRRQRQVPQPKPIQRPTPNLLKAVRLLIVGVGVGAIAGTVLSIWNPATRSPAPATAQATRPPQVMAANALSGGQNNARISGSTLGAGQEIPGLITRMSSLTQGLTDLQPGVFMVELNNGNQYSLNGDTVFASASMIKVPILVAFLQEVDAGNVRLDEQMIMTQADVAEGSGDMQYAQVGSQYSILEVATYMIITSDNTATNMIIRRLGGIEKVNQRFRQWGLQQTAVRNLLPDLQGTNTTSPKELTTLITAISQGQLLSMTSRDRMLNIMSRTETDSLLPTSLGEGATISHKTGDIGSLVGDTGLIDMPNGKRYVISVMVKRPHNDERAQELIRNMATTIYQYLAGDLEAPTSDPTAPAVESQPTDSHFQDVPDAAIDPAAAPPVQNP